MHTYNVIDVHRNGRWLALQDHTGACHLAHGTGDLPRLASALQGTRPALGFAVLVDPARAVYRLIFSQIHCSQHVLLDLFHPQAHDR